MTNVLDIKYIDGNVPEPYLYVQAMLDRFVTVCYYATYDALLAYSRVNDIDYLQDKLIDILSDNPPLSTVPKYLHDGRPNYLWYSDFYFYIGPDIFKRYRQFSCSLTWITEGNYREELDKIDLPYFKELVKLISLEKLYTEAENRINPIAETEEVPLADTPPAQDNKPKGSYEPKLNSEQYTLLADCIENIKLFRRPATSAQLKKLFNGRLLEPLQVMNQLSLVYLLDKMKECGYIKKAWMTTAVENRDFISFRKSGQERRYGSETHYLTMDQLKSRRSDSKSNYIHGWEDMDATIEAMREYDAK